MVAMRPILLTGLCWLLFMICAGAQDSASIQLGCRNWWFPSVRECRPATLFSRPPSHFRLGVDQPWERIGFWAGRIKPHLQTDPAAMQQFRVFRANKGISTIFGVATIGCAVAFFQTSIHLVFSENQTDRPVWSKHPLFWLGSEIGCSFGAAFFRMKASRHLQRSVLLFNSGQTLAPGKPSTGSLMLQPAANGLGPGLRLQF